MILGIHQPYAFPYLGYFQLIRAVDRFILLDDVSYIKQGWINRNRIAGRDGEQWFVFPVRANRRGHSITEIRLHEREAGRLRFLRTLAVLYGRAPFYRQVMPVIENAVSGDGDDLAAAVAATVRAICSHLGITTELLRASEVCRDIPGRGQDRMISICLANGACTYINAEGGLALYDETAFEERGVQLKFLRHLPVEYARFGAVAPPRLSVIDVLMFNDRPTVQRMLDHYRIVRAEELR